LKKDLRKISEEEFSEAFDWLKNETENFSKFPEEIFLKNNQTVLILRCALGLTRANFARKDGINQTTLRMVEMGRKENKIRTLRNASRWCSKITNFLQSCNIEPDKNKAIILWRQVHLLQNLKDPEVEKIKEELTKLNLPDDLRQMSEEQFDSLFNFIQAKTNGFKKIPLSLFTADSRLLLFFRCLLGMSQKQLAKALNTSKDWVRHVEAGRDKIIHVGPAMRHLSKLEVLLTSSKIDKEKAKVTLKTMKFFSSNEEKKRNISSFLQLDTKEFLKKVEELKQKTANFTILNPILLENDPRILVIFRVLLKMSKKQLARELNIDRKSILLWERGERKMSPKIAARICSFLKNKLTQVPPQEEIIQTFEATKKGRDNFFNLNRLVHNGLQLAERLPLRGIEKDIAKLLSKEGINFKSHANVRGIKKVLNVDFAIPNEENPRIVIEAFEFTARRKFSHCRLKICATDQRFQQLKLNHKELKTVLIVKFKDEMSLPPKHKTTFE
jgi:DNA-binding XRE family transcriptional regulator